ncbi:MAG TPA: sulfatase-like hydrolase/transferase [Candidatus Acidoferrales bacterium]|nr:sulfatase-like hydrolase/transferase [Candidatus Acidoferrales bacterium]
MTDLDRRAFVKSVAASLAAPAIASAAAQGPNPVAPNPRTRPPNVIVMICDDLGYGDLGCYGSRLNTPNLNRMASEGVRFLRFNTAHPVCSVSRAAWLTGRYATRSHVQDAYMPGVSTGMDLGEKTLADILKPRGYKSMCIGKWHLGEQPQYLPTNRGFDAYFGVPYSDDMNPLPLIRDLTAIEPDTDRTLLTPRYTEEAIKFIDSSAPAPFFLWLAYSYPHDPAQASPRFAGKSGHGSYGDAVEEIDWSAGEILAAIKRNRLDQDTIVIFTSDHGPWYQGSPGLLRGRKHTTYEGGTRLPFIARWADTIPAGKIVDTWGSNLDLVPTIASICGAQLSAIPVDGIDIANLLEGRGNPPARGTILYFLDGALECARKGSWKLRVSMHPAETDGYEGGQNKAGPVPYFFANPELYNLDTDPTESYDVAPLHPQIVKEILADVDALIPTFPEEVVKAYAAQRANLDSPRTPPGAAPRPANFTPDPRIYDPPRS